MAFGIKRKRGNVQECITKDFKSKCIVNCSSLLLKISLLQLSCIPSPLGVFYFLLFRHNYKNELLFPMDSFTNSRSHSIVGFGTVEKHPLYLLHKHFLPSVVGKVKYSQRKTEARLSDFVTVSDEAFALLCIGDTYDKVEIKYFKEQPDVLNWDHGNMPSPPDVIKSKYTDKKADKASPKLQG